METLKLFSQLLGRLFIVFIHCSSANHCGKTKASFSYQTIDKGKTSTETHHAHNANVFLSVYSGQRASDTQTATTNGGTKTRIVWMVCVIWGICCGNATIPPEVKARPTTANTSMLHDKRAIFQKRFISLQPLQNPNNTGSRITLSECFVLNCGNHITALIHHWLLNALSLLKTWRNTCFYPTLNRHITIFFTCSTAKPRHFFATQLLHPTFRHNSPIPPYFPSSRFVNFNIRWCGRKLQRMIFSPNRHRVRKK